MLIPSCANSTGESPYSFANQHAAPLVSEENHSASRTLTTNQPSVTGASPEPASSSRASVKNRILAAWVGCGVGRLPAPMLASSSRTLPVGDYMYEPKLDGVRALV